MAGFPINQSDRILVTGAGGFIGKRVVASLLERGFSNIRCLVRPAPLVLTAAAQFDSSRETVELVRGNLLSRTDCAKLIEGTKVVLHLAAGRSEKSFPDAFLNSVVTTRNLLDACLTRRDFCRFVNVSSFAVYANDRNPNGRLLDENAPVEPNPVARAQAYCYAKVRQDQLVEAYGRKHGLPFVILRPGLVYGPGNEAIHSRIGLGTFGIFLHCGGSNRLPLTYVDNCADAIVLGGITDGLNGEVINVVDDDLPTSRAFLRQYKRRVRNFPSIPVPRWLSYVGCWSWEKYSAWSNGQLPPVFNRGTWRANWKKTKFTNHKLKKRLNWTQRVSTETGLARHFESCRRKENHA